MSKKAIEIENDIRRRKSIMNGTISNTYADYQERCEEPKKFFTYQICRDYQYEALFCQNASCVYYKASDHLSNNCKNVANKINLKCEFCNQRHSISGCQLNKRRNMHCQYCQALGHEVDQCPCIDEYETCWKCKEIGHDPNSCKNKIIEKSNKCEYCGNAGHTAKDCPDVVCSRCNEKGHTLKFCKGVCTVCEETGHDDKDCEQLKIPAADYKARQKGNCQLYGNARHTTRF